MSEARKYGLNLTVANQYTAQMAIEVKDAVFGNVGSIIAFRMGADDARSMQRYFEPQFLEYDLVHMHNRHFVISLTIDGEKVPAFSAVSLNLPQPEGNQMEVIIGQSRATYASSREVVEAFVGERYLGEGGNKPNQSPRVEQRPDRGPKPDRQPTVNTPKPESAPETTREPKPEPAAKPQPKVVTRPPRPATKPDPGLPKAMAHMLLSQAMDSALTAQAPQAVPNKEQKPAPKRAAPPVGDAMPAANAETEKPKRKRARRRKRKPSEPATPQPAA